MAGENETIEAPAPAIPEGGAPPPETSTPAASSAPAAGAPPAQPRTFTEEQLQGILRDRLKGWQKYGKPEELEARLQRAQELEQWRDGLTRAMGAPGAVPGQRGAGQAPLSEEDRKVQAYLERIYPGLSKMNESMRSMSMAQQRAEALQWQNVSRSNEDYLRGLAKSAGYKDEQLTEISNRVGQSIMGNREDYAAYLKGGGDPEVVKRHFEALDKWVKGFAPTPPPVAPAAAHAAAKGKIAGLPPRMPPAGVPAPTAKKQPLSDKERIDKAYEAFKNS